MKTIFENISGNYTQVGDYLLPNLALSDETEKQIGVWGIRHNLRRKIPWAVPKFYLFD